MPTKTEDLKIIQVKITNLRPSEYNPRQANEKECTDLKNSIQRFGLVDPIIVNSNPKRKNIIIGGHFRCRMATELGYQEVPVVYINISNLDKERELNVRLNKNSGSFDYDLLANFDEDVLKDIGFDSKELDKIFQLDTKPEDDEVPEARATNIKLGDLFKLGEHRLLCGDSTKREDVERLMAGEKADMVFTDPPYNVNYGSVKNHPSWKRTIKGTPSRISHERNDEFITNDNLEEGKWLEFVRSYMVKLFEYCKGAFYICMSNKEMYSNKEIFEDLGGHWASFIIWNKEQFVLSMQDYHRQYEPILYGWKEGDKKYWCGSRDQSDLWNIHRPLKSPEHPTMKPVELCERAIRNSSPRDGLILDLFGGSGSTLIASTNASRRCNIIELEPKYVQVIIDRWEKFTNKKAVLADK
jgi:DNA modification methylase